MSNEGRKRNARIVTHQNVHMVAQDRLGVHVNVPSFRSIANRLGDDLNFA